MTPMIAAATGMASRVKPLISLQGLLTALALVTGIAALFLPITAIDAKPFLYIEVSVLPLLLGCLMDGDCEGLAVSVFLGAPELLLVLTVPISLGYFRWLLRGGLAPWAWRGAYALTALSVLMLLSWIGYLMFVLEADLSAKLGIAALTLVPLGVGTWVVVQNQRGGLPHTLNALIALQVVYVAVGLPPLLSSIATAEINKYIGVWFVLLTVVVYVVQMVLGSRQRRARV